MSEYFNQMKEEFARFGYVLIRDSDQNVEDFDWCWTMGKKYACYRKDNMLGVLCADTIRELLKGIMKKHMRLFK